MSENDLDKYDLLLIDDIKTKGKISAHKQKIYYHNKPVLFNGHENISPACIAKFWFENVPIIGVGIGIGYIEHKLGQQIIKRYTTNIEEADFILIFDDNIEKSAAFISPEKKLYLIGDQNISIENSRTKQHLANSGQIQIFGRPYPVLYEYLFHKFQTKNILSITNSQPGILGAQLNGIDYLSV